MNPDTLCQYANNWFSHQRVDRLYLPPSISYYSREEGDLEVYGKQFPRMQMLTVQEIIEGKRLETLFPQGKRERQMALLP